MFIPQAGLDAVYRAYAEFHGPPAAAQSGQIRVRGFEGHCTPDLRLVSAELIKPTYYNIKAVFV